MGGGEGEGKERSASIQLEPLGADEGAEVGAWAPICRMESAVKSVAAPWTIVLDNLG